MNIIGDVCTCDCPEDPEKLCGQPIGMYHCPFCGCMQVACLSHFCYEPDDCWLNPSGMNYVSERAKEITDWRASQELDRLNKKLEEDFANDAARVETSNTLESTVVGGSDAN